MDAVIILPDEETEAQRGNVTYLNVPRKLENRDQRPLFITMACLLGEPQHNYWR